MADDELLELVRENERLKEALRSLARYAENATFGGWRNYVFQTAKAALADRSRSALLSD